MRSLALLLILAPLQEKKDTPPPDPKILCFTPLGVKAGETIKVIARGLNLDKVESVACAGGGAELKIKSKGKAALPKDAELALVGDTQVEIEVKDAREGTLALVVTTPAGKAPAHPLLILPADKLVREKEQNGGFTTAQPVEAGQWIEGSVSAPKDVDVFKISGKAGERWVFEAVAHRHGSALDPTLTFYAEGGRQLAVQDDGASSRDPLLRVTLPADGTYYLSLIDAHDQGGATHPYLLHVTREP